jgi:hypothetical protein
VPILIWFDFEPDLKLMSCSERTTVLGIFVYNNSIMNLIQITLSNECASVSNFLVPFSLLLALLLWDVFVKIGDFPLTFCHLQKVMGFWLLAMAVFQYATLTEV